MCTGLAIGDRIGETADSARRPGAIREISDEGGQTTWAIKRAGIVSAFLSMFSARWRRRSGIVRLVIRRKAESSPAACEWSVGPAANFILVDDRSGESQVVLPPLPRSTLKQFWQATERIHADIGRNLEQLNTAPLLPQSQRFIEDMVSDGPPSEPLEAMPAAAGQGRISPISEAGNTGSCPGAYPNKRIPHSSLKSTLSIVELNKRANNNRLSRKPRCEAVFTLFASHVAPGSGADRMSKVFVDPTWLEKSDLVAVQFLAGWVPVELGGDRELFELHVLPIMPACPDWLIYFTLSGQFHDAREAAAFLKGDAGVDPDLKLLEFALCFPDGRIERFSKEGVVLYDLSDLPRALYKHESK